MTEPDPTPRRGRRARALSPEESMARTAAQTPVPGVRGAVAPPGADAPVPALRRFGRRARVIEISDETAPDLMRDADGVELGELPVTEAPDPRPAPRFDGRVLHRPERSGGRPLLWLVWALLAIALTVLVILLLTGVIGAESVAALDAALPLIPDHFVPKDMSA